MGDTYAVIGIHDEEVDTVAGNVARVRMFIGNQMIDEDFNLPRIITVEEQINEIVNARMREIIERGTDPSKSDVIEAQAEQIVEDIK